jgi:DNA-binding NtrC family response regulator
MASPETRPRILFLDDDADVCEFVGQVLRDSGYEAVCTTEPGEVMGLLEREPFELFITDYRLGETNGLEICHQAVVAKPDLPVILLTGYGNMDTAIQAIRVGAFDFVPKPLELDQLAKALLESVQRALEGKRPRASVSAPPNSEAPESERLVSLEELEKKYIEQVLNAVGGNKASAARVLGVDRTTLYRKLQRYSPKA